MKNRLPSRSRIISYVRLYFRLLFKYKTRSFVGLVGLAFGLACLVPALYWLRYETTYDSFYPGADRLYRVYTFNRQAGQANELVSGILDRKLRERFPAMAQTTVFFTEPIDYRAEGAASTTRLRTLFTDSTFWQVFPQTVVAGETWRPLEVTNRLVLTESVARRLFGSAEEAVGKTLKSLGVTSYDPPYVVAAVVKDPPLDTNLPFDALLSHDQIIQQKTFEDASGRMLWAAATLRMYVKLPSGTDAGALGETLGHYPADELGAPDVEVRLMPIADVRYRLEGEAPFTLGFIQLLVVAGGLLMACSLFNYLSLHYGLLRQRLREFRLRVANGASGKQLFGQMLCELTCAGLISLLLAACLMADASLFEARLAGFEVARGRLFALFALCGAGVLGIVWLVGGVLCWRLSREALAAQPAVGPRGRFLTRVAVVSQLAVSLVFLVAIGVVALQTRFASQKDLGFEAEGVVALTGLYPYLEPSVGEALRAELASIPQIQAMTDTYFTPKQSVAPSNLRTEIAWTGQPADQETAFQVVTADTAFASTFRPRLLAGEWLRDGSGREVVLNEEAARVMGLDEPVGAVVRLDYLPEKPECRVVGVVEDMHLLSFRSRIYPTLFISSPYPSNTWYLRVASGQEGEVARRLGESLPRIDPTFAEIQPTPLRTLYDRMNHSEEVGLRIFSVLAGVSLLVSLFGVYAVASASTRRRRKEIAIRKVFGATAGSVVGRFLREFVGLALVAGVFALPLGYAAMSRWLEGYAYRTAIPWWLLAGVLLAVVALVVLTVWRQVWAAANADPAEVIKNE